MSNITVVILLMAVTLVHVFAHMSLDKVVMNEVEVIVTGAIRGTPVPIQHRRLVFTVRYVGWTGGITVINLAWALGYFLIGEYAAVEGVRWLAYMFAFLSVAEALSWIVQAPAWYRHLRSVLRQAEAET